MGENITSTADALNVSRVTLYRMLRRHGIVLKRGLAPPPIARRAQSASQAAPQAVPQAAHG
jgi:hypothetical protein